MKLILLRKLICVNNFHAKELEKFWETRNVENKQMFFNVIVYPNDGNFQSKDYYISRLNMEVCKIMNHNFFTIIHNHIFNLGSKRPA